MNKIVCKLCGKDLTESYNTLVGSSGQSEVFFAIHILAHLNASFVDCFEITELPKKHDRSKNKHK